MEGQEILVDLDRSASDDPFELLLQLLGMVLRQSPNDELSVLVEVDPGDGTLPPLRGAMADVAAPEAVLTKLSALLETQTPVVWMPLWTRPAASDGQVASRRPRYEQTLQQLPLFSNDSAIAVVLPLWGFGSPNLETMREIVLARWDLVAVIEAEGINFPLGLAASVSAVVLRSKAAKSRPIKMFRIADGVAAEVVTTDFRRLLRQDGGASEFGYVLRELPESHTGLRYDFCDPAIESLRQSLSEFGDVVPLSELFEFPQQIRLVELKAEWECAADVLGAVRVLGGRDIDREGTVAPPDDDTLWARPPEKFHLRVGDVLVRKIYRPSTSGGLILATVRLGDLPAVAADALLIMRPRNRHSVREVEFALRFLRTPTAQMLVNGTASRMRDAVRVHPSSLEKIVVPQPDRDLADALEELEAAKVRLQQWQTQADEILASVFLKQTPAAARTRVIESGRTLRLRVEAAALLDDLGYTVRTRFPYPIAARWRTAEALQSAAPSREAYGAILDVTEILLCYTALLILALAREAGVELGAAKELQAKLQRGRSGPGLGEWVAILSEAATTKRLRSLPSSHPLNSLRGLLANQLVEGARQRLTDRRNDQAHMRHIDPIALPDAVRDAARDLRIVIGEARFLTDWPLVQVTAVRRDTLARTSHIEYRELMGDHPVVPTSSAQNDETELEIGSLYLRGPDHRLHLLRPYLIGRDCPTCRTWSTFHVDKVPGSTVVLKSLEHGHTVEDPSLNNALRIVGLI